MTNLLTREDRARAALLNAQILREIMPVEINRLLVSEWAEKHRVLPRGLTPYPGPFSFDMIPYMREIADSMSESSPVREVMVLKGTQIAATVGLGENWIGYKIESAPSPMLYVSGDAQMAETQMELRIDAMINSSGLGHLISSQHKRSTQRKTGDLKARKEFPGGFLMAAGPNSGAKLRSMSFKDIYVDELDGFRGVTVGNEGDVIGLIRRRVDAFSETYKILWTSTPTIEQQSLITRLYREGDQRVYHVPCKHCGHMQPVKFANLHFDYDDEYRLDITMDKDGQIVQSSVHYECEKCGGHWQNADKDYFLPLGEWRPTATPRRPGLRSYHVPGLLSPVGFRSWESGVMDFLDLKAKGKPPKEMQIWVNTFLGEAFVDETEKPRIEAIMKRERRYVAGTLPMEAEPIYCTIGADVQKDRIEAEVVAWGRGKESWSIDYHIFPGDTSDLESEAWQAFRELIESEPAGMEINMTLVDSGYRTDTVYEFADSFDGGVYPCMGSDVLARNREYIKPVSLEGHTTQRFDINTTILKQELYKYLNREWIKGKTTREGFCHFPSNYTRQHYLRLTAETATADDSGRLIFKKVQERNEQLDARVYAMAGLYGIKMFIESLDFQGESVSWPDFWEYVAPREESDEVPEMQ